MSIIGLTVSDPTAYSPAKPEIDPDLVVVPQDGAEEGAAGDGEAAPVPVDDPAFVTNPLITAENFVAIPVSIEISGEYSAILNFVKGLQSRDRLFLVSTLSTARENGSSEHDGHDRRIHLRDPDRCRRRPAPDQHRWSSS